MTVYLIAYTSHARCGTVHFRDHVFVRVEFVPCIGIIRLQRPPAPSRHTIALFHASQSEQAQIQICLMASNSLEVPRKIVRCVHFFMLICFSPFQHAHLEPHFCSVSWSSGVDRRGGEEVNDCRRMNCTEQTRRVVVNMHLFHAEFAVYAGDSYFNRDQIEFQMPQCDTSMYYSEFLLW